MPSAMLGLYINTGPCAFRMAQTKIYCFPPQTSLAYKSIRVSPWRRSLIFLCSSFGRLRKLKTQIFLCSSFARLRKLNKKQGTCKVEDRPTVSDVALAANVLDRRLHALVLLVRCRSVLELLPAPLFCLCGFKKDSSPYIPPQRKRLLFLGRGSSCRRDLVREITIFLFLGRNS